ncbi:MAG: DUF5050 domain-containing protein [Saccharofermentanales bacterium]
MKKSYISIFLIILSLSIILNSCAKENNITITPGITNSDLSEINSLINESASQISESQSGLSILQSSQSSEPNSLPSKGADSKQSGINSINQSIKSSASITGQSSKQTSKMSSSLTSKKSSSSSSSETSNQIVEGNGGNIVKCGDWIYYCVKTKSQPYHYLYKIKEDKSNKTMIKSINTSNIFIDGDWIYYQSDRDSWDNKASIYKIKKDGSGDQKIYTDEIAFFKVSSGWIYFCKYDNSLFRVKTDGTQLENLNEVVGQFYLLNNFIYYTKMYSDFKLNRMDLDGFNKQVTSTDGMVDYINKGGIIYFIDKAVDNDSGQNVCKMNSDFSNRKILDSSYRWAFLAVSDSFCFSIIYSNRQSFYRFNKNDGSDKKMIDVLLPGQSENASKNDIQAIKAFGSWVYFRIDLYWYRCRPDGTAAEAVDW